MRVGYLALLSVVCSHWASAQTLNHLVVPVTATCISSPFGPRIIPNLPEAGTFHPGVDLPVPEGTPVKAAAAGRIVRIQNGGKGGLEILIEHGDFVGVYSHLGKVAPLLEAGKTMVAAGEELGVVGHTGLTLGMHLYFGMLKAGQPVDPAPFLRMSMCDGTTHMVAQAAPRRFGPDGKLLPTRHYLDMSIAPLQITTYTEPGIRLAKQVACDQSHVLCMTAIQ